jgi:hypothetical protein
MTSRLSIARFAVAAGLSLAAYGCSSATEAAGSSTAEAFTKCPPGQVVACSPTSSGRSVCYCAPPTIDAFTDAPTGTSDTCDLTPIDVPDALAGMGCSRGILVDGQPVWACPENIALPASIGAVAVSEATCAEVSTAAKPGTCEQVMAVQSFNNSGCVGAAHSGWVLVIDSIVDVNPLTKVGIYCVPFRGGWRCKTASPNGCPNTTCLVPGPPVVLQ